MFTNFICYMQNHYFYFEITIKICIGFEGFIIGIKEYYFLYGESVMIKTTFYMISGLYVFWTLKK